MILVRGGTVVNASGRARADVRVAGETIVEVAPDLAPRPGERVIDAAGRLVLPGAIDPHTHLIAPPGVPAGECPADDLESGSAAALAGGITTVGVMSFPGRGEGPLTVLQRDAAEAARRAIADVILHPVLAAADATALRSIPSLRDAGHTSVKLFTSFDNFDTQLKAFVAAVALAGDAGLLTLVHCEDAALVTLATQALVSAGRASARDYAESRPVVAEVVATQRAVALCEATGAPIYVVHLSSARALAVCDEARGRDLPVYVEIRPIYLHLTEERYAEADGGLYVAQPPLRQAGDVAALWDGLARGAIHALGSDHVGWSRAQKLAPGRTIADPRPGLPDLETMLPQVHSDGVAAGRLTVEQLVALSAANPARLFGLYPRKGVVAPGSDADLVVWDPGEQRLVRAAALQSRAGYSSCEGRTLTGWPRTTIRRGEIVWDGGRLLARPGSGRVLERGPTAPLV